MSIEKWIIENEIPYVEAPEGCWKEMDGKVISIDNMELGHIVNCIKKIDRDDQSLNRRKVSEDIKDIKKKMVKKKQELKDAFDRKSKF